jgi:CheY-like chemotaxis protein
MFCWGEDSLADVYLIRKVFEQHRVSCNLYVASNGEEGLDALQETAGSERLPDLVILDVNFPRWNRLEDFEI